MIDGFKSDHLERLRNNDLYSAHFISKCSQPRNKCCVNVTFAAVGIILTVMSNSSRVCNRGIPNTETSLWSYQQPKSMTNNRLRAKRENLVSKTICWASSRIGLRLSLSKASSQVYNTAISKLLSASCKVSTTVSKPLQHRTVRSHCVVIILTDLKRTVVKLHETEPRLLTLLHARWCSTRQAQNTNISRSHAHMHAYQRPQSTEWHHRA